MAVRDLKQLFLGTEPDEQKRNALFIVNQGFPEGASVWCEKCGLEKDLSKDETVSFLLNGLECCGARMKL